MKDSGIFSKYRKDVMKYPLLTIEEERKLAREYRNGDRKALDKMVNANLRLVIKIAMEYDKGAIPIMDIIQNGNMGLIRAAEHFDPEMGVKFSTYSAFWIKQSILRGFVKTTQNVSISYRKSDINKKIKVFINEYLKENSKYPSVDEITNELHVKRRDAVDILMMFKNAEDMFNPFKENWEEGIEAVSDNTYNPEEVIDDIDLAEIINGAISSFDQREQDIIKSRYGFKDDKETLSSLGERYSVSSEAIRQIEKRVLKTIKDKHTSLYLYICA